MIDKIGDSQVPDILKEASAKQLAGPKLPANNGVDASLQVNCDSWIEKAKNVPPEDPDAVQRAQQLILSGQLDSIDDICKTAECIAMYGI